MTLICTGDTGLTWTATGDASGKYRGIIIGGHKFKTLHLTS